MKKLLIILFIFIGYFANSQILYDPTKFTPSNKSYGSAQAIPTEARSQFRDTTLPSPYMRNFANRAEILSYLYLAKYRAGKFPIYMDSASHTYVLWFRDGTSNGNLVYWNTEASTTDSSIFETVYRTDTAKLNLRISIAGKISTILPAGQIIVGNPSNVATAVAPSNDVSVTSGGSFTVLNQWKLVGNSGTTDLTNFIGTTDNVPLSFKVNGFLGGRIDHLNANAFLGYRAGRLTTAANNSALGHGSLLVNTSGGGNTAIGSQSLFSSTLGSNNTSIGYNSLLNNTTGVSNTALGYNTGLGITTGNYNTIIGANVTGLAAGLNNNIILADGQGNQRLNIDSSGTSILTSTTAIGLPVGNTAQRPSSPAAGYIRFNTDSAAKETYDGSAWIKDGSGGGGGGSLTSVATNNGTGITGGTITTTGTLAIDTTNIITTKASRQKLSDSLVALINGKQSTGNYITALTGDATAAGPGSAALTLATITSAGSCISCNVTYDAKGRATAFASGNSPLRATRIGYGNASNSLNPTGRASFYFDSVNSALHVDSINMPGSITQNLPGGRLRYISNLDGFAYYVEAIDQSYTNFNGIRDVVWTRGWNVDGAGGRLNDTASAFGFADESLFNSGPGYQNEHYFYGISRSGKYHRYLAWNVDDTTGKAYAYTEWDGLQMFATDSVGNVLSYPYFSIGPGGGFFQGSSTAPSSVRLTNPYHLGTWGDLQMETNVDGSSTITNNYGKIDLNAITTEITGAGAYPLIINQADSYNGKGIYIQGHVTGPSYPIHIATASDADQYLYNQKTGTGNAVAQMWSNGANVAYILSDGGSKHFSMGIKRSNGFLTFAYNTGYFNAGEVMTINKDGLIGIGGVTAPVVGLETADTTAWRIPVGSTAQQPSPVAGYIRFDSTLHALTYGDGTSWITVGSGGGTIPPNLGSAYRVYAPQTPGFKTLHNYYGVLIDSTTTGELGIRLDSATVYTYVRSLITGSDSVSLRKVGTGEGLLFGGTHDTLNHKSIAGLNSINIATGPDSTINVKLVNDTAIGTAASYYYGTSTGGSAGRLGYYALPSGGVTTMGAFGSTPNSNGASISGATLTLQPANGSNPGGVSTTTQTLAGAKTFSSDVSLPHLIGTTSTPSIAAGAGAGTSPTVSIVGNDMAGTITIVAGTLPTAGQVIATVTFTTTLSSTPRIVLQPANQAVGSATVFPTISVSGSTTQFYINANTVTGLAAGLTYSWNYIAAQ